MVSGEADSDLEGLEMIVVLVIIVAFVKALEQLGLLEVGDEGKIHTEFWHVTCAFDCKLAIAASVTYAD
ncbi:hypothetical protein NDU88_006114 [Pleurodeles waltl]|uniref:Uncharacterized protein n=1 Tax=Pleurodeles waltl TaxID=8319 RepID=A0AAV7PK59_PLEWA|nr:hypothetical protein NDU88_006114 [Pleurodeles waltl]